MDIPFIKGGARAYNTCTHGSGLSAYAQLAYGNFVGAENVKRRRVEPVEIVRQAPNAHITAVDRSKPMLDYLREKFGKRSASSKSSNTTTSPVVCLR